MILPSKRLPLSKIQEIDFESTKQATDLMDDIMLLYNNININLCTKIYKPILLGSKNSILDEEVWQTIVENTKLWARGDAELG